MTSPAFSPANFRAAGARTADLARSEDHFAEQPVRLQTSRRKSDRGAISLSLARADAYVFGDDQGAVRVPDAVTSRWTRRLDWACAKIEGLPRVTLKGLRHTHATLLLELGEHPKVVQGGSATRPSPRR